MWRASKKRNKKRRNKKKRNKTKRKKKERKSEPRNAKTVSRPHVLPWRCKRDEETSTEKPTKKRGTQREYVLQTHMDTDTDTDTDVKETERHQERILILKHSLLPLLPPTFASGLRSACGLLYHAGFTFCRALHSAVCSAAWCERSGFVACR